MYCPAPFTVNAPFAKLALPATPTDPTSPSDQPDGSGVTVNVELFADSPFTTTEKSPEDPPEGTIALIAVSAQVATEAVVPFSETVLLVWLVPKFNPVIVTMLPTGPEVGEMPAIDS
jgi:hypothetical protein